MARAAVDDLAVTTDIIVGFPGRDRGRLRAHPRGGGRGSLRQRLHVHLLAPAGDRGGRAGPPTFVPADVVAERFERLRVVVERSALAPAPGPGRAASRRSWSRARPSGTRRWPAAGPGRASWSTSPPVERVAAGRVRRGAHHPGRAPLPRRRAGRGDRPAPAPDPHPGGRRLIRHLALVGCTASGKSGALALALALAAGEGVPVELVSIDSMQVYRGMDIGTAKPTAAEQAEVRHHLIDLADPAEDWDLTRHQSADGRRATPASKAEGTGPCWSAGPGCTSRPSSTASPRPGVSPTSAPSSTPSPTPPLLHRRLERARPAGRVPHGAGNRRRVVRALEVTLGSGRPFSSFGPGVGSFPATRGAWPVCGCPGRWWPAASPPGWRPWSRPGWSTRCALLAGRPGGLSRTARQALGYREVLAHLEDGVPLDEALDADACAGPGPSPGASGCGGGGIPGSPGTGRPRIPSPLFPACWETGG